MCGITCQGKASWQFEAIGKWQVLGLELFRAELADRSRVETDVRPTHRVQRIVIVAQRLLDATVLGRITIEKVQVGVRKKKLRS